MEHNFLDSLLMAFAASMSTESDEDFARECIKIWRLIIEDTLYRYHLFICRAVIEDWVRLGDIHVVHFEKVLINRVRELSRILNFLDIKIDQRRMSCVEFCENDMFKRNANNQTSPPFQFTEMMKTEIDKNIQQVDHLLERYGHDKIPFEFYSE